jgi:error-prone DNA polymerase
VAIVRPGPIQGGAVHPYLRRRAGLEPVAYLHPTLEPVLTETLGVLLFQEQVLRVAVAAAGFTPGEADLLRRALARKHSAAAMEAMRRRFLEGAREKGIDAPTAGAIFGQLEGFAGYGFPKSHAASFALIAYQSMWLKRYRPAAFYAALLNLQPMGFYPVEVLAGDARRHGVAILPPDVNRSGEKYAPERTVRAQGGHGRWALRTGLASVAGLGEVGVARVLAARAEQPFAGLDDFCARTLLDRDTIMSLIRAGACDGFGDPPGDRRALLWRLGEIDVRPAELPIPAAASQADLPGLEPLERTLWEYELLGLTSGVQLMQHYRKALSKRRIAGTWEIKQMPRGARARTAGMVAIRQRPQTAHGIVFMSLEDESGLLDLVVKPEVWARLRSVLRGVLLIYVEGEVQRTGLAVSLLVREAAPLLPLLEGEAGPQASRQAQGKLQRSFF